MEESKAKEIHRRYFRAQEVRNRINELTLPVAVERMERMVKSLDRFKAIIDVDVHNENTSVTKQLLDAITALVQLTSHSMESFKENVLKGDGLSCVEPLVEMLIDAVRSAKSLAEDVDSFCNGSDCENRLTELASTNVDIDLLRAAYKALGRDSLHDFLSKASTLKRLLSDVLPNYRQSCCADVPDTCTECYTFGLTGIDEQLSSSPDEGEDDDSRQSDIHARNIMITVLQAIVARRKEIESRIQCCQSSVTQFLNDFQTWHDPKNINATFASSSITVTLDGLYAITDWLTKSVNEFSNGEITQVCSQFD
jgi:hypothetical protein